MVSGQLEIQASGTIEDESEMYSVDCLKIFKNAVNTALLGFIIRKITKKLRNREQKILDSYYFL